MRRSNSHEYNQRDDFKDFCSSEEEICELEEMASLLSSMDKEEASPSFRSELKRGVLRESRREEEERKTQPIWNRLSLPGFTPRSVVAAAAAGLLMVVLATYYVQGEVGIGFGALAPEQRSEGIALYDAQREQEKQEESRDLLKEADPDEELFAPEKTPGEEEDAEETGEIAEEGQEETQPSPKDPSAEEKEEAKEERKDTREPKKETDKNEEEPAEDKPPKDPEFDIWKEHREFKLAGAVDLPGSNFEKLEAGDHKVNLSFDPNRYMISAAEEDAQEFGTRAWAREILSQLGFVTTSNDYLKVDNQESQKGKFAEVYYKPRGSGYPTLFIYYQEKEGIHSFYYEERGAASTPGYYELLSPSSAFAQARGVELKATSPLQYSFKEVSLTYHEFVVEENGRQKKVKLPAYEFTGMETRQDKGEARFYVPAVKQ